MMKSRATGTSRPIPDEPVSDEPALDGPVPGDPAPDAPAPVAASGPTAAPRGELAQAARGGAVTFLGSALSSVLGFVLSVLLARELGSQGAGVVLQAIAIFTIALSVAKLGLDTTAVWLLPRLRREQSADLRAAVIGLLVPAVLVSAAVTLVWFVFTAVAPPSDAAKPVYDAVTAVALFLPAASVMTVALASTRAFGGVLPYNVIGNILVPLARPVGLLVVVAVGGSVTAAALTWSLPWLLGAVLALVVLLRGVLRTTAQSHATWRPSRSMMRDIMSYSLPRTFASVLEQAIIWLDVVLVGIILGSSSAGVYGSAARFVSAGFVVFTALRIVVAPRFSALLAGGKLVEVEELYSVTAKWILLFGAPIYVLLGVFAPTVLGWLGAGFGRGASSMITLCFGSIVFLAAGNVQSLLLMSGKSGWVAVNKTAVLTLNVVGNLVLVPRIGIVGAAATWAASMLLDTALAVYQVRRGTGISVKVGEISVVLAAVCVCTALPSLAVALLLGQGFGQLVLAAFLSGLALIAYCAVNHQALHLGDLRRIRS